MSEIEDEIRRQMLAEREQAQRTAQNGALPLNNQNGSGASPFALVSPEPEAAPAKPNLLKRWQSKGGLLGSLATGLLLVLKFIAPAFKFLAFLPKLLVAGGSMAVSMWTEAQLFGWPFGIGFVLLIFIHECGHAFAAWRLGHPIGFMVFIPMMGAMVSSRGGRTVTEQAYVGIMGPVVGTAASLACAALYLVFPSPFWLTLAKWGFFINLFNLAPTPPLDGGWIAPIFSPKLLAFGVVLLFVIAPANPLIWILALLSVPRILRGWKADPSKDPYYHVTSADRWKFGMAYLGLVVFLALGYGGLNHALKNIAPQTRPSRNIRYSDNASPSRSYDLVHISGGNDDRKVRKPS